MYWWGKRKRLLIEFAQKLAEDLYKQVPPEVIDRHLSGKNKKATRKFYAALDKVLLSITEFKAERKLGVYGKAKFHQVFAEHLKELGYPPDLVDEINTFIITKIP
jgi:hypothetical protein